MKISFKVDIDMGDVFINGEFASQLCWNSESVGYAIAEYLAVNNIYPSVGDYD